MGPTAQTHGSYTKNQNETKQKQNKINPSTCRGRICCRGQRRQDGGRDEEDVYVGRATGEGRRPLSGGVVTVAVACYHGNAISPPSTQKQKKEKKGNKETNGEKKEQNIQQTGETTRKHPVGCRNVHLNGTASSRREASSLIVNKQKLHRSFCLFQFG